MSDRRSTDSTVHSPGRPRTASAAFLLAVVAALLAGAVLVVLASSGVAADTAAADTAVADTADPVNAPTEAVSGDANETTPLDATDETPLDGANGTVEVVVRFTPIEDPADRGSDPGGASGDRRDAVVDDLREHAAEEQDAFADFAAEREGITVERELWLANAMVVTVDTDAVSANALLSVPNVTAVHENVEIEPLDSASSARGSVAASHGPSTTADSPSAASPAQITADPSGRATAGLRQIDAPAAWERFGTRGSGATVTVIDTGVDPRHQDIELDGWAAFDQRGTLVSGDLADAGDSDGHGTHVAGTVAGGNASGTHIGVAPAADLHAIDVFAENETATFAGVIAAMEYATTGVGVVSAEANTTATYVRRQGTSTAAPHVAGVAALAVAATDGRVDDATLQAAIVETAVHPANATAPDDRYGHGVVDAPAAVGAAVERTTPEPSAADGDEGNVETGGTGSDPSDSGAATDDATPGFGPVPALVALAVAAALAPVTVRDP